MCHLPPNSSACIERAEFRGNSTSRDGGIARSRTGSAWATARRAKPSHSDPVRAAGVAPASGRYQRPILLLNYARFIAVLRPRGPGDGGRARQRRIALRLRPWHSRALLLRHSRSWERRTRTSTAGFKAPRPAVSRSPTEDSIPLPSEGLPAPPALPQLRHEERLPERPPDEVQAQHGPDLSRFHAPVEPERPAQRLVPVLRHGRTRMSLS